MKRWQDVPIPEAMQDLPRDRRGYPVPSIVFRIGDEAFFITNDDMEQKRHGLNSLCSICGKPYTADDWCLAGGPASAFHPQGAFRDPPMHIECCRYAMKVCPYISLPKYRESEMAREAHKRAAEAAARAMGSKIRQVDHTSIPGRPKVFVVIRSEQIGLIQRTDQGVIEYLFKPIGAIRHLEYWRHGAQIPMTRQAAEALMFEMEGEP